MSAAGQSMTHSRYGRQAGLLLLLGITAAASAEMTARLEDWIRFDIPILSEGSDSILTTHDEFGVHGNPNAKFKKWRLNNAGFRSDQSTALSPDPECTRVMVIGASETFGLYESDGKEYPAQLSEILNQQGCYEVLNAAIPGMTVRTILFFWEHWASRFAPAIVVVYPSPAFYLSAARLADAPPPRPRAGPAPRNLGRWWIPRLWDRAKDRLQFPAFVQRRRVQSWLRSAREGQSKSWFFETIPQERLDDFTGDVEQLVCRITATGARAVVVTHANAFHNPVRPDEQDALDAWNATTPRATPTVLLQFEREAATALIEMGRRRQVMVIDAASHLYGRKEWFAGDMIHFSDEGANAMAKLIAEHLLRSPTAAAPPTADNCAEYRRNAVQ